MQQFYELIKQLIRGEYGTTKGVAFIVFKLINHTEIIYITRPEQMLTRNNLWANDKEVIFNRHENAFYTVRNRKKVNGKTSFKSTTRHYDT